MPKKGFHRAKLTNVGYFYWKPHHSTRWENIRPIIIHVIIPIKGFGCDRRENIVGKAKKCRFLPFSSSSNNFFKPFAFQGKWKTESCLWWRVYQMIINSLPNDKILDWSKFKAFADNKINVTEKLEFVSERIVNIVKKGEKLFSSILSVFHNVFKKLLQGR